jgi:hypothetical protein
MIRGATAGKMVHPRGEAAVIAIRVTVFQHALKNCLHDVFRDHPVTGVLDEETEKRAMMPLEQLAQRIEFARADREHQSVVGTLIDRGFHGAGT